MTLHNAVLTQNCYFLVTVPPEPKRQRLSSKQPHSVTMCKLLHSSPVSDVVCFHTTVLCIATGDKELASIDDTQLGE